MNEWASSASKSRPLYASSGVECSDTMMALEYLSPRPRDGSNAAVQLKTKVIRPRDSADRHVPIESAIGSLRISEAFDYSARLSESFHYILALKYGQRFQWAVAEPSVKESA